MSGLSLLQQSTRKYWLNSSLNRKFVIGIASGLIMSSLVFLLLFITMYRGELENQRAEAATQINRLLQASLENAMLKRDLDGLRSIVNRLGSQENIHSVRIINPKGEVRFSNRAELIYQQMDISIARARDTSTSFIQDDRGNEVLRSINPVHNKAPCIQCHGPLEKNPVNGTLLIDYDATPIRQSAQNTTLLLMGSGALIVVINITGGWWFIRRFVLKPLEKLATASNAITDGNLDFRTQSTGSDELAQLGQTFDRMTDSLQIKIQQLQEKEVFLQALINAIPDGIRIIDENFKILLSNKTYREQLQLNTEDAGSQYCYASSHGLDTPCPATFITCPIQELSNNKLPLKFIHQHTRMDGSQIDVEIYASPMNVTVNGESKTMVVESIRDLAEQVKFSHEQKLAELGHLAAGVSHEIHNPLTAVRLALHSTHHSLHQQQPDIEEISHYLELVNHEIDTCIDVTERLLKLSTPPPSQSELVSINKAVGETISLLRWEAIKDNIELTYTPGEEPLRVMATDSEIRMTTLNLAQNAFHAMPEGGSLDVSTARLDGQIFIRFRDTGKGIAEDNLQHIFEPFFSRRVAGDNGTGLGLSISKNIVENYKGKLTVESTQNEGSCFTIQLPDAQYQSEV